jgi:hypothetical protein
MNFYRYNTLRRKLQNGYGLIIMKGLRLNMAIGGITPAMKLKHAA